MTTSNVAAQVLVRAYLRGRSMDEIMFAATVWMADVAETDCCGVPKVKRRIPGAPLVVHSTPPVT